MNEAKPEGVKSLVSKRWIVMSNLNLNEISKFQDAGAEAMMVYQEYLDFVME